MLSDVAKKSLKNIAEMVLTAKRNDLYDTLELYIQNYNLLPHEAEYLAQLVVDAVKEKEKKPKKKKK